MSAALVTSFSVRRFTTTLRLHGKKNFRKFPLYNKRGSFQFKATREKADYDRGLRHPGKYVGDEFVVIPEMIPEIIVPDLTGFKLKPYVSYRVPDVVQSEFTAQDLFDACYTHKIADDFKNGKLDENDNPLAPNDEEKMSQEEAWVKARQTGCDLFCPEPPLKEKNEPFS